MAMMATLIILKIMFLFLAVFFLSVNLSRLFYKQTVTEVNFMLMTLGIVGFAAIHWELYL